MNRIRSFIWLLVVGINTGSAVDTPAVRHHYRGTKAIAATGHPLATEAAMNAFRRGGNAVDAAVAAGLTLGIVDGHNSGIGGGCFMLIHLPNGKVIAIDGREMAPANAHRDMFLQDGKAVSELSKTGALASGIPGSLAVYDYALKHFGNRTLSDGLLPAAKIAEEGFAIDPVWARKLRGVAQYIRRYPESASLLLKPDESPMAEGDTVILKDLANTYRSIAQEGIGYFYGGAFARATERWMADNGGIITAQDFANYEIKIREPLRTTYRGHEIYGFPPPSSGGVHVAQILNILENFDLAAMNQVQRMHVVIESQKLAFADRAFWLGDADFADVPKGLADKSYARQLASRINLKKATDVPEHGTPPRSTTDLFNKHTTHFTTADASGLWVACTATINTGFGSKVIIPGTGVILNNQMDDFSAQPGVPNAFGLLGAEANAIAPGKRPLSSMSPTIVLRDGKPVMSVGAAGGPTIITQSLLAIIRKLDLGMSLKDAIGNPRYHHQWSPDQVRIERAFSAGILEQLRAMGHSVDIRSSFGASQTIAVDGEDGFEGVSEPRIYGRVGGF